MSRSVMTHPDAVATAFIDGSHIEDSDEFDWFVEDLQHSITSRWKSMDAEDRWVGRELRVIAENRMAYVTVSEYCGLVAVCLVSKSEDYLNTGYADDASMANLADQWTASVAPGFLKAYGELRSLGFASNGEQFLERIA